jgi:drug/metabolite transporter (DMT)-like permease
MNISIVAYSFYESNSWLTISNFYKKIELMNNLLAILAVILGIVLIIAGVVYFIEPARYLPGFFPGFDRSLMTHHYKHGIGSILLGVACFVFAWFQSGKKKAAQASSEEEKN